MGVSQPEPVEPPRVGIRQLRHDFRTFLQRVEQGERFIVTDRGRPIADISPHVERESVLDRLVREGRAIPAQISVSELGPPVGEMSTVASDALREMRDEERLL